VIQLPLSPLKEHPHSASVLVGLTETSKRSKNNRVSMTTKSREEANNRQTRIWNK